MASKKTILIIVILIVILLVVLGIRSLMKEPERRSGGINITDTPTRNVDTSDIEAQSAEALVDDALIDEEDDIDLGSLV